MSLGRSTAVKDSLVKAGFISNATHTTERKER